jgi:hypothetical protein
MDLSNLDLDYMIPKGTSHTSVPKNKNITLQGKY